MAGKPIKKKSGIQTAKLITPTTALIVEKTTTGNATARRAAQILLEKQEGFALPTPKQKKILLSLLLKEI